MRTKARRVADVIILAVGVVWGAVVVVAILSADGFMRAPAAYLLVVGAAYALWAAVGWLRGALERLRRAIAVRMRWRAWLAALMGLAVVGVWYGHGLPDWPWYGWAAFFFPPLYLGFMVWAAIRSHQDAFMDDWDRHQARISASLRGEEPDF